MLYFIIIWCSSTPLTTNLLQSLLPFSDSSDLSILSTVLSSLPTGGVALPEVDAVIRAIHDVKWLGLATLINFTGGEIFTPHSPILELLAVAKEVDILTRANTNGWWGGQSKIKIGNRVFPKDEDVVQALVDRKLMRLALSLDNRYEQYPKLLDRVVRVASLCEAAKLPYEVVATQPSPQITWLALQKLIGVIGSEPYYVRVSPMETVDVGAAALQNKAGLDVSQIVELVYSAPCGTKGFHRPAILHIAPDGGVVCMPLVQAGWGTSSTNLYLKF